TNNPSIVGAVVGLNATVAGLPLAVPTGTVTFLDGTQSLGTADLRSGSASLLTTGLAVGTHVITAVYNGDTSYNGSTSVILRQVVNAAAPLTISGQKFDDRNGNGIHDPDEPGLDGWTIQLVNAADGSVVATQTTHNVDLNHDGQIDPQTEQGIY